MWVDMSFHNVIQNMKRSMPRMTDREATKIIAENILVVPVRRKKPGRGRRSDPDFLGV